jgi:hypothetical protein
LALSRRVLRPATSGEQCTVRFHFCLPGCRRVVTKLSVAWLVGMLPL